jgi:hypothetical protein
MPTGTSAGTQYGQVAGELSKIIQPGIRDHRLKSAKQLSPSVVLCAHPANLPDPQLPLENSGYHCFKSTISCRFEPVASAWAKPRGRGSTEAEETRD